MSASKYRLYWRLQLAAHYMQKFADRELAGSADITAAQTGVLTVIATHGEVNQKQVAVALGLNESAVTAMVRRLVSLKYLRFKKSRLDGRVKILSLTSAGETVQKQAKKPFNKVNQTIESVLTPDEVAQVADCLIRLGESFERKNSAETNF